MNSPFSLWLEYEHLMLIEASDPEIDFCNVQLTLADGAIYPLNVWTYKFLQRAIEQARVDGENLNGQYLEPPDLFVERLDRSLLEEIFDDLIRGGRLSEQWKVVVDANQRRTMCENHDT